MRANRFDPASLVHQSIHHNPRDYTRASRRAVGYRKPVGLVPEGVEVQRDEIMPRYARRHGLEGLFSQGKQTRRQRKMKARTLRSLGRSQ